MPSYRRILNRHARSGHFERDGGLPAVVAESTHVLVSLDMAAPAPPHKRMEVQYPVEQSAPLLLLHS